MDIFATKILLATDGSEEAELAARKVVDLADATEWELRVVHVGQLPNFLMSGPDAPVYSRKLREEIEEERPVFRETARGLWPPYTVRRATKP
jgi:nucleotide-binding universal stress UspA family protein